MAALPQRLIGKESPGNTGDAGDAGSVPGSGRSLEQEMATRSSTLAWRVPGTEEPGRLLSMALHRVGHH